MGCVNRTSKEFKNLTQMNNVSSSTMELIVHKYWQETGNEGDFPPSLYIQSQLGSTQYVESSENVRNIYNERYTELLVYNTMEELETARQEALKFFPEKAVVWYKDTNDKYTLSVKEPVDRISSIPVKKDAMSDKQASYHLTYWKRRYDLQNKLKGKIQNNKNHSLASARQMVKEFNRMHDTNFALTQDKRVVDKGLPKTFSDVIEAEENNATREQMNDITSFMQTLFPGIKVKTVANQEEFANFLNKYHLNAYAEAVLIGDTIYTRKDLRNADTILEEFLHPFVEILFNDKQDFFNAMLAEAKSNFSLLEEQINSSYSSSSIFDTSQSIRDKELVTQALSRHFRESLKGSKKTHNKFSYFLNKFIRFVKDLFGYDNAPNFAKTKQGTQLIPISSLTNLNTLHEIADALNTKGISFNIKKGLKGEATYHLTHTNPEEQKYETEKLDEYHIAVYKKPDDTIQVWTENEYNNALSRSIYEIYKKEIDNFKEAIKQKVSINTFMDNLSSKYGFGEGSVEYMDLSELFDWVLKDNGTAVDIVLTDKKDKESRLMATYDNRQGGDFPNLSFLQEPKKSKNAEDRRPQPFTFKDGIVIDAPFKPNAQQVEALNQMDEFVHSDESSMTLSGYAGTGKTSLMEMLAKKLQKEWIPVMFCATTNKAAAILKSKVSKAGFTADTLNKVFGIQIEVDPTKTYSQRNMRNKLKEPSVQWGTTIIIDEASMINEENYSILNDIAKKYNLKIIYVGDKAQLAPVNEEQISKVFRNNDNRVVELTQVERTDDNAILKEATDIRNGKELSGESSFNKKGEGVAYIKESNKDAINKVINYYVQGLKGNSDFFRILAFTNDAVSNYNTFVRIGLGYRNNIPRVEEPMIGYSNWGYEWKKKSYRFINSESYKVVRVDQPKEVRKIVDGVIYIMTAIPITLENSMGERDTFNYMDIKGNQQNKEVATKLAHIKKDLWEKARSLRGRGKGEILDQINDVEQFLFVNDSIEDSMGNLLQSKVIDFGYALTIHKSQGSTFTHVLIDDVNIISKTRNNNTNNEGANASNTIPVGLEASAPMHDYTNSEVVNTEVVDLGEIPMNAPTSSTSAQTIDVRQQLEYVAVSRATDTVTIISDNVKKEDSPLNHINNSDDKTIENSSTFATSSNSTVSDNSANENTNINNDILNITENEYTDEFRRVHKGSIGLPQETISQFRRGLRQFTEVEQKRLGAIYERLLTSSSNAGNRKWINLKAENKGTSFEITQVNGQLFHDIFEINRQYLQNGELVDLHDNYDNCKCYVTKDGLQGFAIEEDGNLVSVFSLNSAKLKEKSGFLYAIKDFIKEQGATHLDAYASPNQNLEEIYQKTLGFRVASEMDFNMEYDHDGIAKNHNMPNIVFMVASDYPISKKHFTKDEYNAAEAYQKELLQSKNSSQHQEQTNNTNKQKVSLPGYEYFTDKYENTTVDAPWKVPLLQNLDKELSNDKTAEENNVIIRDMEEILKASSEEEYKGSPNEEKQITEKVRQQHQELDEYDRLNTQINNLLDSTVITASEIRHTADLVVNAVSDIITAIQHNPQSIEIIKETHSLQELFPNFKSSIDLSKASRKEIINAIGIDSLIYKVKEIFEKYDNLDDIDSLEQANLITDNWEALIQLASDVFVANEGISVVRDYSKKSFTTGEATTLGYDNFNQSTDSESIKETEGNEQEHWQVEQRTIDVLYSMSEIVRQAINQCYQIDKNGNKIYSKWGIAERVQAREVTNSLLRWMQGSQSLEDMVNKLRDKQIDNPWVGQLLSRLSDTSGNETTFQSQFYSTFQKAFQNYSIVINENGKYASILVNSHPALSEAMQSITTQFKLGQTPLFTLQGVNKGLLGNSKTTSKEDAFNLHKVLTEMQIVQQSLNHGKDISDISTNDIINDIAKVYAALGYQVTDEMVKEALTKESFSKMATALSFMVKNLDKAAEQTYSNAQPYEPFAFGTEQGIGNNVRNFLSPITEKLEDVAVNAFYDSGKMYQSYVTPSFLTNLFKNFKLEGEAFEDFIQDKYGSSEWFKEQNGNPNTGWKNEWLRLLTRKDGKAKGIFDHKVQLNFNKHNYMKNMEDAEYALSLITEYFSEAVQQGQSMIPAWFRIPMMSNKPSSEFIKFYSYRGASYKEEITDGLYKMFLQELSRIQTVNMRNLSKNDPAFIQNFDSQGKLFNYLPFLNPYILDSKTSQRNLLRNEDNTVSDDNSKLSKLLKKKIDGTETLTSDEEAELMSLTKKAIRNYMDNRVSKILENWEEEGIINAAEKIKNIGDKETIKTNLENFIWNDYFAAKNILQLTITDIAFYKDAEDLQKRLAQLHAPGLRGNVNATDFNGKKVSDGKYRTFILTDWDKYISNICDNIGEIFDRKIQSASESNRQSLIALKESLVGENGRYRKINVADAQGFSSPSSYRKKALMFGKWSREAEDIYQKLLSGTYTYTDLETAFQPLKPFVYTKVKKHVGVEGSPIQSMEVAFQAKNSEYLIILADAILRGEKSPLGRPNLLRAIYDVMEESERLNPTKGIDTVQFESAIKSGLQGKINLTPFLDAPNGEKAAFNYMMDCIFKSDNGVRTTEYNSNVYVHESDYNDYCLQQDIPEHFQEHYQSHGSQIRMIIPSDLDLYKNPNGDLNAEGNKVYYEWDEADGTHRKVTAEEYKQEYENTIAENIQTSLDNLVKELHLDSEDMKERNITLSKLLQREILGSPRYGVDLLQACSIDKNTGKFRIPLGDPIQAKRIEQLLNSLIKNRVNKQEIAGGPVVQVSNFGTSQQLNIRFKDKNGNLLMSRQEWEAKNGKESKQTITTGNASEKFNARYGKAVHKQTYKEYIKENQAGIAYFEVYAPIWSKRLFEQFANADGTIDIKTIEELNPELLKMIGYRIPTEDKYSCAPMKVVGFMPREAGDAIMLPQELTEINDSDFDIDKTYVMRKDIPIKRKKNGEIIKAIWDRIKEETPDETRLTEEEKTKVISDYKEQVKGLSLDKESFNQGLKAALRDAYFKKPKPTREEIAKFVENPQVLRDMSAWHKKIWEIYKKVAYYTESPLSGKLFNDNKIIDMTWAVLTNEMSADKILNPGGFDELKKIGYATAAFQNPDNKLSWEQLQKLSIDELKELSSTEKDLTWIDTQIQFYHQNMAGSNLIGVAAVNKVAHATLEADHLQMDIDQLVPDGSFSIAGFTFEGRMTIDPRYDTTGTLIGKTLGAHIAASADTAKTPVLDLMNINMTTIAPFMAMLRFGMPLQKAALFMSQRVISNLLNEFNMENLSGFATLNDIINRKLKEYEEEQHLTEDSQINKEGLSEEELIQGLKNTTNTPTNYKVLKTLQKLITLSNALRKPTFATRFNSISSAVGPLIIDNLIMEYKMEDFMQVSNQEEPIIYDNEGNAADINTIFDAHPILKAFSQTVGLANNVFKDMPLNSSIFRQLLKEVPDNLRWKLLNDRKLFDNFANFFNSYLLIASQVINPKQLNNYVNNFPKYFFEQHFDEKYSDNALIKAIHINTSKTTGRAFLTINTTGMDNYEKEKLSSAWIDLHKKNPELSKHLFMYCFFRAGIGFSPKTFLNLVPTYVKERITTSLSDGRQSSYVDTFEHIPNISYTTVIDQFIRNNWDNGKLVPKKGSKKNHYIYDWDKGLLIVDNKEELFDLSDVIYMKTKKGKETYLWKLQDAKEGKRTYKMIKPLGDNGEYLEMSLSDIERPLSDTTKPLEIENNSEIQETSNEITLEETPVNNEKTLQHKTEDFINGIMQQNNSLTKEQAIDRMQKMKDNPTLYKGFIKNVLQKMNVTFKENNVLDKFKEFC